MAKERDPLNPFGIDNPDYDYELRKELRYPTYPIGNDFEMNKMKEMMEKLQYDKQMMAIMPTPTLQGKSTVQKTPMKLEEFTALVIPGWEYDSGSVGKSVEIRIGKDRTEVVISLGGNKLSVSRDVLQQLVAKLHEEFQMEKLSK